MFATSVLVWWGCSHCHSGHYEVSHQDEYTTYTHVQVGKNSSIQIPVTHPEQCYAAWVCDWTCEALDKGRAEAHPKHAPFRQIKDTVDLRCTWDGVNARLKR